MAGLGESPANGSPGLNSVCILHVPALSVKHRRHGSSRLFRESPSQVLEVGRAHDEIAVEAIPGRVAGDGHRDLLRDAQVDHGPHGRPPEVVPDHPYAPGVLTRALSGFPEILSRLPSAPALHMREEMRVGDRHGLVEIIREMPPDGLVLLALEEVGRGSFPRVGE